jgi:hypothetical protein
MKIKILLWIPRETSKHYEVHILPRSSRYHLVHKFEGRAAIYVSKRFEIK